MHPQPWTSPPPPHCSSWLRPGRAETILLSHPRQSLSENIWRCESFTTEWPITVHFSLHNPGNASWMTTKTAASGVTLLPRGINILLLSVCIRLGTKPFLNPVYFFHAMRTRRCPDGDMFFFWGAVDGCLTHGWSLVAAPRPTLGSEQGDLSLQHFHPGDQVLDGGCRRTTACSLRDVDAVGERHLEFQKKIFQFELGQKNQNEREYPPGCQRPASAQWILLALKDPLALPSGDWTPTQHGNLFQNKKRFSLSAFYIVSHFEVKDQLNGPSVGPGDAAESSSTEQRDSKGTLMLYTWLNTRGCSLAVWFSEDKGGAWPPADVCRLTLVVRTSLSSADGAAGEEPWRDGETGKTFSKKAKHRTCLGFRGGSVRFCPLDPGVQIGGHEYEL